MRNREAIRALCRLARECNVLGFGIRELYTKRGISSRDVEDLETYLFEGKAGLAEACLHELCHARLLGLAIGPRIESRVSAACPFGTKGEEHEALTLVVEYELLKLLNFRPEWDTIVELAEIQNVEPSQLDDAKRSPSIGKAVADILHQISSAASPSERRSSSAPGLGLRA